MNILFIHEVDWMRKIVYDVHVLAEAMSLLGHNVYAIDYESMWDGTERPKELEVSRVLPEAKVHLMRTPFIKVAGLSRLSASFMQIGLMRRVIKEKKIDAIVLYSVPTNGLQALYLARSFGIPIVFRALDALYELVKYPVLKQATWFLERQVYSHMDKLLTLTPKQSEYMVSMGAKPERCEVLPMTVDLDMFQPTEASDGLRQMWGIGEYSKVVLYMGTLYHFSGLEGFIKLFPLVMMENPDARLLIVGDGPQRAILEKLIREEGLSGDVVITGFQPYKDMTRYINMADVCINPFIETGATRDIFPGKVVQFLACGRPLVHTPLPGICSMVSGVGDGVVYAKTIIETVDFVNVLLRNDAWRESLGKAGMEYTRETHSCMNVAKKLEAILEAMK